MGTSRTGVLVYLCARERLHGYDIPTSTITYVDDDIIRVALLLKDGGCSKAAAGHHTQQLRGMECLMRNEERWGRSHTLSQRKTKAHSNFVINSLLLLYVSYETSLLSTNETMAIMENGECRVWMVIW